MSFSQLVMHSALTVEHSGICQLLKMFRIHICNSANNAQQLLRPFVDECAGHRVPGERTDGLTVPGGRQPQLDSSE